MTRRSANVQHQLLDVFATWERRRPRLLRIAVRAFALGRDHPFNYAPP
jgi:hypothetical protein